MANKEKRITFETKEKEILFSILNNEQFAFIKSRDNSSDAIKKKKILWEQVELKFVANPLTRKCFSIEQLKTCFKNESRRAKGVVAEQRKQTLQTGGGTNNAPVLDSLQQSVLNVIGKEISPIDCPFDSDAGTFAEDQMQPAQEFARNFEQNTGLQERIEEIENSSSDLQPNMARITIVRDHDSEITCLAEQIHENVPVLTKQTFEVPKELQSRKRKRNEVFEYVANEQTEVLQLKKTFVVQIRK